MAPSGAPTEASAQPRGSGAAPRPTQASAFPAMLGEAVEAVEEDALSSVPLPSPLSGGKPSSEISTVPAAVRPKAAIRKARQAGSEGKNQNAAEPSLPVAASPVSSPVLLSAVLPVAQAPNRRALPVALAADPLASSGIAALKEVSPDPGALAQLPAGPNAEAPAKVAPLEASLAGPRREIPENEPSATAQAVLRPDTPPAGVPAGNAAAAEVLRSPSVVAAPPPATSQAAPPPPAKPAAFGMRMEGSRDAAPVRDVPAVKPLRSPAVAEPPANAALPRETLRPVAGVAVASPAATLAETESGATPQARAHPATFPMDAANTVVTLPAAPVQRDGQADPRPPQMSAPSALPSQVEGLAPPTEDRPATPEAGLASRLARVAPRAKSGEARNAETRDTEFRDSGTARTERPDAETRPAPDRPVERGAASAPRLAFTARLVPLPTSPAEKTAIPEDQPEASPAAANPSRQPQAAHPTAEKPENTSRKAVETADHIAPPAASHVPQPDAAAGLTPAAGTAVEPARSEPAPAPAAPVRRPPPAPVAEEPAKPSAAAHEIKLQLSGSGERVEVRLVERAGDVHLAVRTPDARLAEALREDLPALASRLEQSGFRAESWHSGLASPDRRSMADAPSAGARQDSQNPQDGGGSQSQHQRQQQDGRRPSPGSPQSQSKENRKDFAWLFTSLR